MRPIPAFKKLKLYAQARSDASGWNRHVNKRQRRTANKVLRRVLKLDNGGHEGRLT